MWLFFLLLYLFLVYFFFFPLLYFIVCVLSVFIFLLFRVRTFFFFCYIYFGVYSLFSLFPLLYFIFILFYCLCFRSVFFRVRTPFYHIFYFFKKEGQRGVSMLAAEYWCVFWRYVLEGRCRNVKESKCFMIALTNESTSWWVWRVGQGQGQTSSHFSIKDCFFTNTYWVSLGIGIEKDGILLTSSS